MSKFFAAALSSWTRRDWLTTNTAALMAARAKSAGWITRLGPRTRAAQATRSAQGTRQIDAPTWEAIARQGVEAARAAGASYADVRLTRLVQHLYAFSMPPGNYFAGDMEVTGAGVRVLVNGYWGFSAAPRVDSTNIARLAQDAVAQATCNALGTSRIATLAPCAPAHGKWATPMRVDPFSISIEEKNDYITSWLDLADRLRVPIFRPSSGLRFTRQERTVATSDGSVFTQRLYETAGAIVCVLMTTGERADVEGLQAAGKGWEMILDANIPEQLAGMSAKLQTLKALHDTARPAVIGRYTVVCDGATMASLVDQTVGLATQLDRALGYEANASGTSYIDDPLAMIGTLQVASPLVTITANRSAPTQLATVQWDDEGVVPQTATLVNDGLLTDFQTTREQASWLAPYYERAGRPVASHGYAGSETGLAIPLQHVPNLALEPSHGAASVDDLVANVANGVLVTGGAAMSDFQVRNGMLAGNFRKITNGRLGPQLNGGALLFNTLELWRQVSAVAGKRTIGRIDASQYPFGSLIAQYGYTQNIKGQPPQLTGHSVTAPAATITGLAMIDPTRKA
jgi:TldD protein